MSALVATNNNREIMRILPTSVANELFAIGWQAAADLCADCRAARPQPSIDECLGWIAAARQRTQDQTIHRLWLRVERGDDEFIEMFEWAALRLAREGFETCIQEGGR